jgi:hypothetical protein
MLIGPSWIARSGHFGFAPGHETHPLVDARSHVPDPRLQRPQLLGVLVAGLVVGGNGSGDGRERKACGGRISISGGLGQFTGGCSVVQT